MNFRFYTLLPFILFSCFNTKAQEKDSIQVDSTKYDTDSISNTIQKDSLDSNPSSGRSIKDTFVFVGAGDLMLGTNFPSERYLPKFDPYRLLKEADSLLSHADLSFVNLEGSFLNEGPVVKKCRDTTLCYAFKMPDSFGRALKKAGIDFVSLANNHSGDFGNRGRSRSLEVLDSLKIKSSGLAEKPYDTFKVGKIIYGVLAFSPNVGTPQITDTLTAVKLVKELDEIADIVVVSFHGGAEGSDHQNVNRETEEYYGEDRGNVYRFSHLLIDNGADILIGHGPHVPRAIELYKNRLIAYSLGNFCTYARFNLSGPNGLAPVLEWKTDSSGRFLKGKIHSFFQRGEGGLLPDPSFRCVKKINTLTNHDFPETKINISKEGIITLKATE